jgi:hypothetical protein
MTRGATMPGQGRQGRQGTAAMQSHSSILCKPPIQSRFFMPAVLTLYLAKGNAHVIIGHYILLTLR